MQSNPLTSALMAALIAQFIKIPISYLVHRHWDWRAAFRSGGMPSSHTALMVGLTSTLFLSYGWNNPYVSISTAVTLIVMYDATGVRREAGEHAMVINELTDSLQDIFSQFHGKSPRPIPRSHLKEVLGHKPTEVLGGLIVGILVAFFIVL